MHAYFKQPNGKPIGNGRGRLPKGIDVRGVGGFVIAPGANKNVLVRAVGPTLGSFGVAGSLASPVLTLFNDRQQAIASNTRWNSAPDKHDGS